jgi:hypothetical protein
MKRAFLLTVLVVMALVSGFYQEKLKISINYILDTGGKMPGFFDLAADEKERWIEETRIDASFDYYHNHQTIKWLYLLDQRQLAASKWIVTGGFILLFLLLNRYTLATLGVSENVTRLLPRIYAALILFSLGVYAIGIAGLGPSHCYAISRKIMGALQSVVPVLILWPAAKLWTLQYKFSGDEKHE